jgi:hypothetical protein
MRLEIYTQRGPFPIWGKYLVEIEEGVSVAGLKKKGLRSGVELVGSSF